MRLLFWKSEEDGCARGVFQAIHGSFRALVNTGDDQSANDAISRQHRRGVSSLCVAGPFSWRVEGQGYGGPMPCRPFIRSHSEMLSWAKTGY